MGDCSFQRPKRRSGHTPSLQGAAVTPLHSLAAVDILAVQPCEGSCRAFPLARRARLLCRALCVLPASWVARGFPFLLCGNKQSREVLSGHCAMALWNFFYRGYEGCSFGWGYEGVVHATAIATIFSFARRTRQQAIARLERHRQARGTQFFQQAWTSLAASIAGRRVAHVRV